MKRFAFILLCVAIADLAGCTSVKSTLVTRDECNLDWEPQKVPGVPTMVRVPTHLRVDILNIHYFHRREEPTPDPCESDIEFVPVKTMCGEHYKICCEDPEKNVELFKAQAKKPKKGKQIVECLVTDPACEGQPLVKRDFRTGLIYGEKIFCIDPRRPASGGLKTGMTFSNNQSLQQLQTSLDDDTIEQSSIALARSIRLLSFQDPGPAARAVATAPGTVEVGTPAGDKWNRNPALLRNTPELEADLNVREEVGIVASRFFNIEDPDFELQVAEFLQSYCLDASCLPLTP